LLGAEVTNAVNQVRTNVVRDAGALAFDEKIKQYDAKIGDTKAEFTFALTNVSTKEVVISGVRTSCGCTVAQLPQTPWQLAPNGHGEIHVTVDLTGKYGLITKIATVQSSEGDIPLTVRVQIPSAALEQARMGDRSRNTQIAQADRQAVFRGDCSTCHVTPTLGKTGRDLFVTACGICHESSHRASMVPDLRNLKKTTDAAYWTQWIREGKTNSLMPAFALRHGGILSDPQIRSLTDYLTGDFVVEAKVPGVKPAPASAPAVPAGKGPATF
jgi:mono/diheme cytochrome c family protein